MPSYFFGKRKTLQEKRPAIKTVSSTGEKVQNLFSRFRSARNRIVLAFGRKPKNPKETTPTVIAVKHTVKIPHEFGGKFVKGERVLYLHFHATNPRDMVDLIQQVKGMTKMLHSLGFSGIYGDSQNAALITKLKDHFGGIEIIAPKKAAANARKRYKVNVRKNDYSPKYLASPVTRLVIRFDEIPQKASI